MTRNKIIGIFLGLLLAVFLYNLNRPGPEKQFQGEIARILRTVNQGRHLETQTLLSPEALQTMENSGLNAAQLLRLLRDQDTADHRQYRLHQLCVFIAGDYAEVEFQRSGAGGTFSTDTGFFSVPFLYRDSKWWVAGAFHSSKTWQFPD